MKQQFLVTGMSCASCSAHVEKAVAKLAGMQDVHVNLLAGTMRVQYDESIVDDRTIIHEVEQAGYGASIKGQHSADKEILGERNSELCEMKNRVIVSFIFLILLMYISMGPMVGLPLPNFLNGLQNASGFALTQFLLTLPIIAANRKYFFNGFKALWHHAPTMDSLIAVGASAAVIYGIFALYQIGYGLGINNLGLVAQYSHDLYFESAGMILTLVTLGKYFETRARKKTGEAITKLMDLRPQTATVLKNGIEQTVPIDEVQVDDLVVVRPGQSIPVDGVITKGHTALDEAALTGESLPIEKGEGDSVIAATINKTGYIVFRASRVGDDTTLSQIIRLVEEASASKAPIAKLADQISGIFVPVVLLISLFTFVVWLMVGSAFTFALSCGIAVLVISCPCALGLATPVAIMVGTGVGAENGVLFQSAEALEHLHKVNAVVLDKTGTVTEGHPVVTDVVAFGVSENELLSVALSLEQPSEHPLAEAVVAYATAHGITASEVSEFIASSGKGISANIAGMPCMAGNSRFMKEACIDITAVQSHAESLALEGKTPLFFAQDNRLIGLVAIADVVKPTSAEAVKALQKLNIDVTLLTGDNKVTAEAIRRTLSIPRVIAEVLPQDKEREIRALQESGRVVAMVGDGINDAPALARADVGIAIGAGTDVAISSADVVLMKSDLMDAVNAVRLSRSVIRNIRQNLFWAFFYNCIGIPLAAGLLWPLWQIKLSPMFGAAAMSLSSVCVVTNALRLKMFKPVTGANKPVDERKEVKAMTKTIVIEGMMCTHCSGHVKKSLEAIPGVNAQVSHETGTAIITLSTAVDNSSLSQAIESAGYKVVSIA